MWDALHATATHAINPVAASASVALPRPSTSARLGRGCNVANVRRAMSAADSVPIEDAGSFAIDHGRVVKGGKFEGAAGVPTLALPAHDAKRLAVVEIDGYRASDGGA